MATEQQLLTGVLTDPDADEPRLAYAGHCAAQGDPRGEFIRLQIEAMRLRRDGWVERSYKPADEAAAILDAHRDQWLPRLGGLGRDPRFYRGFVEGITFSADGFLADGAALYSRAPIRHVRFESAATEMAALSRSKLLAQLVSISFDKNQLGDREIELLAASPHLKRLRMLDLGFNHIGMAGLEALCAAATMPALAYVNLTGNGLPNHQEGYGVDTMSGTIVPESVHLDQFASQLEARFGRRAWFHPVSELPIFPPLEGDF